MRKAALAFLALALAANAFAADAPPPPLISAPSDDAPPPPSINIDGDSNLSAPPPMAAEPTATPEATEAPTPAPTLVPSAVPTAVATPAPTPLPTAIPTDLPTPEPSPEPTAESSVMLIPEPATSKSVPPPMVIIGDDASTPAILTETSQDNADQGQTLDLAAPVVKAPIQAPDATMPNWVFTPEAKAALEAPAVVAQDAAPLPTPSITPTQAPTPVIAEAAAESESGISDKEAFNDTVKAEVTRSPESDPNAALNASVLLAHGRELEDQGRYFEAWNAYQDLGKQYPGDLRGVKALNTFYARRLSEHAKKLEKAQRYYEAANLYRDIVMRDASDAEAWFGLGSIFYHYRKHEAATYCFKKVVKLKPKLKGLKDWLEGYERQ